MRSRTLRALAASAASGTLVLGGVLVATPAQSATKWPNYATYTSSSATACARQASANVQHMWNAGHQAAITTYCHRLRSNGSGGETWSFTMGYAFGR